MSGTKFTVEFKRDVVAQVADRGYPVREVAERLGVSTKSICTWQKLFSRPDKVTREVDAQADEIRRLKRDLARVTEERDIRKKATRILRQGIPVRYAFIVQNRLIFAVRAMCRMLLVHPSGFMHGCANPFPHARWKISGKPGLWKRPGTTVARSTDFASCTTIFVT